MDRDGVALRFLAAVLPSAGLYCAAVKLAEGKFRDTWCSTIEELWTALKDADRDGCEAYFTLASFDKPRRLQENVFHLQALSVDLDYGKAGHAVENYASIEEARDALKRLCELASLPTPILLKSGGGLQAHWPLRKPVSRETWQRYAEGLKQACLKHGVKCDNGLTVNAAHIMRPPGVTNRKLKVGRPTEMLLIDIEPYPLAMFAHLRMAAKVKPTHHMGAIPPRPAWIDALDPFQGWFPDREDLVEFDALADACGVIGRFRQTGDCSNPAWFRIASAMHYVVDGETLFHEHSRNNYSRYKLEEAQSLYDRTAEGTGPPRCSGFMDETDQTVRAICQACPLLGTIVSPIQGARIKDPDPEPDPEPEDKTERKGPYFNWDMTLKSPYPRATYKNACLAIDRLKLDCRHDVFHQKKYIDGEELTDPLARSVREKILVVHKFDPGKQHIQEALDRECERCPFNPVLDYLNGLAWDGKPRIDQWLTTYFNAEGSPLNSAFGRKVLIAGVRRVRQPGCKFDYLLVLEGEQGTFKSSAWRIMAGDANFSDQRIKWDDPKQQKETMAGVWIHEIAELAGFRRADIEAIKSFLSRQDDRERAAYDRYKSSGLRCGINVATVNPVGTFASYVNDPTGARRFWPVRTGFIDLVSLKGDRDQLWAEAAHYEKTGEALDLPSEHYAAAAQAQDLRRMVDPWQDILSAALTGDKISSNDIYFQILGAEKSRLSSVDAARIAACMRLLGWDGPKFLRIDGKGVKGYERSIGRE